MNFDEDRDDATKADVNDEQKFLAQPNRLLLTPPPPTPTPNLHALTYTIVGLCSRYRELMQTARYTSLLG